MPRRETKRRIRTFSAAIAASAFFLLAVGPIFPLPAAPQPESPPLPIEPGRNRQPLRNVLPPSLRLLQGHDDEESTDRPPLAMDRQTIRQLESAEELFQKKNYSEGILQLQHVLDNPEDSWVEPAGRADAMFQSARQRASDRIGRLPASARESYETEFGQVARRMLNDAKARGDRSLLEETVRRFFHTRAGHEAAYLLGNRLLDASMPLAAARQFDRLRGSSGSARFQPMLSLKAAFCWLRAGLPERSKPILAEMRERAPGEKIKLGGHSLSLFRQDEDSLRWLAGIMGSSAAPVNVRVVDWPIDGGTPDHNGEGASALPLGKPVWSQSVVTDRHIGDRERFRQIESTLENYVHTLNERGALTVPAVAPLIVGHTAVFRTLARLRAVDLRTGEPLWESLEADRQYKMLTGDQLVRTHRLPVSVESPDQDDARLFLNSRSFLDRTYGMLGSDGQRVFAIFENGFLGQGAEDFKGAGMAEMGGPRPYNILAGLDLSTGQLLWEIGGSRTDRARELAGTFFLGCGLPVGSALYCMGERDGEISLFKLDAANGHVLWTQRLALPAGRLPFFPLRRMAGGSPSYSAGLLVCPLTAGVVVACDPASQGLVWEYRYHINVSDFQPKPRDWMSEPILLLRDINDEGARWLDSSPTIAEGFVLLTPRDSHELHCVNLADGTLRWKRERGSGLYVACVYDGAAYVVGRGGIEALRMADGNPLWEKPIDLPAPAGHGFRTGRLYHLPLVTGELATIDLHRGRVMTRSQLAGSLQSGNLVSAGGTVLLQSAGAVCGFRPMAEIETGIMTDLERKPNDPIALAARGELRLHRGEMDQGLEDLLQSIRMRPDGQTQSLATATVLENLRFDFARYRKSAERIEPLIVDPTQRFQFHQLFANRLEESGDLNGAFGHQLRLARDESLAHTLVHLGEALRVQVSQLVAPAMGRLYANGNSVQRTEIAKSLEPWIVQLNADGSAPQLAEAADMLRDMPEGTQLRRTLVERLAAPTLSDPDASKEKKETQDRREGSGGASGTPKSRQTMPRAGLIRQLMLLRSAKDAETAATATAELIPILLDHGRAAAALPLLEELETRFGGTACAKGKTGRELARTLREQPAVKDEVARLKPWPRTRLAVARHDEHRPVHVALPLLVYRRGGSYFDHWRFEVREPREQGFTLAAIDEYGTDRWQLPLDSSKLGGDKPGDLPIAVRLNGPLLELLMHGRIVLFDALDAGRPPRLLWSRPLNDPRWSEENQRRSQIGLLGFLTDEFVFYSAADALCCADPVSGRVLWERRGLPPDCSLQGDADYVVALNHGEPTDPSGTVLHAATGTDVFNGVFGIPGPIYGDWGGRHVLTTVVQPAQLSLSYVDLAERKPTWTQNYSMPALWVPVDDEEFAVLDADARLRIHAIHTGAQIAEIQIERRAHPWVRRIGNHYLIIVQSAPQSFRFPRESPAAPLLEKIWMLNRQTGKVDFTTSVPVMQFPLELPEQSPVLVLARPLHPSGGQVSLTVIDWRNGEKIYESKETVAADRLRTRLDPLAHRFVLVTDKFRLEITPTETPLSLPAAKTSVNAPDKRDKPAAAAKSPAKS